VKIPAARVQNVAASGQLTVWNVIANMFGHKIESDNEKKRTVNGSVDLDFNSLEQLFAAQVSPLTAIGGLDNGGEQPSTDYQSARGVTDSNPHDSVGLMTLERRRKSEEVASMFCN
jgi:hypothetical protein